MRHSFRSYIFANAIAISFLVAAAHAQTESREALLSDAWRSFNDKSYPEAIRSSSECVNRFRRQAERDQAAAVAHNEPIPDKGKISRTSTAAQTIFDRGVLNDVSACYFVLGSSQAATGNCAGAKRTFQDLKRLTYARIWDPKGWFWDPSLTADDWLVDNGNKC